METRIYGWLYYSNGNRFEKSVVCIENGWIKSISPYDGETNHIITPLGFDAHHHVESSIMTLGQAAPWHLKYGVGCIATDFHEAGNAGGVDYILHAVGLSNKTPLRLFHGVPSSIPADPSEHVGTPPFTAETIRSLFDLGLFSHLSEVMAYPLVSKGLEPYMSILQVAKELGYPIDGHACGLSTDEAVRAYFGKGISTNHECTTLEEAVAQIEAGVKIWIRRGSAADNFEALHQLISMYPGMCGFCTDDLHPDGLIEGRGTISMARDALLRKGHSLQNVIKAWCVTPRAHYTKGGYEFPLIGTPADIMTIDIGNILTPDKFEVSHLYIGGELLVEDGIVRVKEELPKISCTETWVREQKTAPCQFYMRKSGTHARVITVTDGSLITGLEEIQLPLNGYERVHPSDDILMCGSLNRYVKNAEPSCMLVKGLGARIDFAIVSSVNHDTQSPIYVGTCSRLISNATNTVIENKGGLCLVTETDEIFLPLPIYGLCSSLPATEIARRYAELERIVTTKLTDGRIKSPFMMLSFLGLTVIPDCGIGDDGLYVMTSEGPKRTPVYFTPSLV
jgi:adenine deaminase